jgi:hypothetical protein
LCTAVLSLSLSLSLSLYLLITSSVQPHQRWRVRVLLCRTLCAKKNIVNVSFRT